MTKGATNAAHPGADEPREYSVYIGRERLGRLVRLGKRTFEAFDHNDRALGAFCKQKIALAAISAASKASG